MEPEFVDSYVLDIDEQDFSVYGKDGVSEPMSNEQFKGLLKTLRQVMDFKSYKNLELMLKKAYGLA